jgi:hypothetical protein
MLGFVGLFLIGLIGFVADRMAAPHETGRAAQGRVPQR